MRTYRRNSPQAAARIVALTMIADGHVDASEERALARLDVIARLGLGAGQFDTIVQGLCEDLAAGADGASPLTGHVDRAHLAPLLAEVDDPAMRGIVLRACLAVASADDYLADGEIAMLAEILSAWSPVTRRAPEAICVA